MSDEELKLAARTDDDRLIASLIAERDDLLVQLEIYKTQCDIDTRLLDSRANEIDALTWQLVEQTEFICKGMPEIVICAAIRLSDGRIFRGHRHCHCINLAYDLVTHQFKSGYSTLEWECPDGDDQGFISSKNRYVTREEGLRLQLAAGIESVAEGGYRGSILFSEDLY